MNNGCGIFDDTLVHQICPVLFRYIKLGMDGERFFNADHLFINRRIVELAIRLVSGACVIEHT